MAVISYNPIPPYAKKCGIIKISGVEVLILSETFTHEGKKGPEYVLSSDPNWQEVLKHKETLKRLIIFAGKASSGALEIIKRAVKDFAEKKEILFFVLCDHDLDEKMSLLISLGIVDTQWMWFGDNYEFCQETPLLLGYMNFFAFAHHRAL